LARALSSLAGGVARQGQLSLVLVLGGILTALGIGGAAAWKFWPRAIAKGAPRKSFAQAAWQIVVADVSMSLDNVLAVAGAAKEHPGVLVFGLALSIALMGFAASFIAGLLQKHRWIAFVGFAIILYVALRMMYEGAFQVMPLV
jgi:predicted tellurium resistance membrane protein TerC